MMIFVGSECGTCSIRLLIVRTTSPSPQQPIERAERERHPEEAALSGCDLGPAESASILAAK